MAVRGADVCAEERADGVRLERQCEVGGDDRAPLARRGVHDLGGPAAHDVAHRQHACDFVALHDDKVPETTAHHRSRSAEYYWAESRAAISRDGRYVIFDSNMNLSDTGLNDYTDVYLIRVY